MCAHVEVRAWWRHFVGWGGVLLAAILGCGGEPFDILPVTGKVTYEDGSVIPAKELRVEFIPQTPPLNAATHPRPGMAYPNPADGTFSAATTHKYGDGLTVGKHKVIVRSLDEMENETDAVPKQYRSMDTTPLEIEVASGKTHLELKVKKP